MMLKTAYFSQLLLSSAKGKGLKNIHYLKTHSLSLLELVS